MSQTQSLRGSIPGLRKRKGRHAVFLAEVDPDFCPIDPGDVPDRILAATTLERPLTMARAVDALPAIG